MPSRLYIAADITRLPHVLFQNNRSWQAEEQRYCISTNVCMFSDDIRFILYLL